MRGSSLDNLSQYNMWPVPFGFCYCWTLYVNVSNSTLFCTLVASIKEQDGFWNLDLLVESSFGPKGSVSLGGHAYKIIVMVGQSSVTKV
jgi:hypothetical protein